MARAGGSWKTYLKERHRHELARQIKTGNEVIQANTTRHGIRLAAASGNLRLDVSEWIHKSSPKSFFRLAYCCRLVVVDSE